jgi:hypothetical protein
VSIIDQENAKQAAYVAKLAEAEALPHQPPAYRRIIQVTRNDLQGNPMQITVGAIAYDAAGKKLRLETTDSTGAVTGAIVFEEDCLDKFSEALLSMKE